MTPDELLAAGWTVDKALLYDEECVEGWTWTSPTGKEFTEIGDWSDPPVVPEEMQK